MANTWTHEQALSLAPDPAVAKAAQGLSSTRKWSGLGSDGSFVWGLAQGSGASPYQVGIDLGEPAFKCSCPSRKFPCKHGLGLLLLLSSQPGALPAGEQPAWVVEWVSKRAERSAKKEAKAAEPAGPEKAPADPAAQEKRREKRLQSINQGVELLQAWLRDLARQGLGAAASKGYDFWDSPARRMVDAQAPGLARRVRLIGNALLSGAASADSAGASPETAASEEIGRLNLLLTAWTRRAHLSAEWQAELDSQVGLPVDQDTVRQGPGEEGPWFVGAQTSHEEDKIITRCSYLFSPSGKSARLLEFSPTARPAVSTLAPGRWLAGQLAFFPGVNAQRALWKTQPGDTPSGAVPWQESCEAITRLHAAQLARNPLSDALPFLARLTPYASAQGWVLSDGSAQALPLDPGFRSAWELLALSGGRPLALAGLWDGSYVRPLTAFTHEGTHPLGTRHS